MTRAAHRVGELPTSRRVTRERATMRLVWPLGPSSRPVTLANNYGQVRNLSTGSHVHKGVDMVAPVGTEIRCALAGVVEEAGRDAVMGNYVIVYSPEYSTRIFYMHMRDTPRVDDGDAVRAGEALGVVGTTGRSSGPHLHFQVQTMAGFVDPYPALALARQREGVEGVGSVGDEGDDERELWAALERTANGCTERARTWQWPAAMLDAAPEGSETRAMMREVREEYQRAVRTWVDAFKAWRARGDLERAAFVVERLARVDERMQRFARERERASSRTIVEQVTHATEDARADLAAAAARVAQAGTNIGLGIGVVLVVVGAVYFSNRRGHR